MKIENVILGICLLVLLGLGGLAIYGSTSSNPYELKTLIDEAATSTEASALIKEALTKTPAITVSEFYPLKKAVKEQLAVEFSRKFTGDGSLQTPSVVEKAQHTAKDERTAVVVPEDLAMPIILERIILFAIGLAIMVGMLSHLMYKNR